MAARAEGIALESPTNTISMCSSSMVLLKKTSNENFIFFCSEGHIFSVFLYDKHGTYFSSMEVHIAFLSFHAMYIGSSILHVYFNYIIKCIGYFVQIQKRMLSTVRKMTFFPLWISSVNVTKYTVSCGSDHKYWIYS